MVIRLLNILTFHFHPAILKQGQQKILRKMLSYLLQLQLPLLEMIFLYLGAAKWEKFQVFVVNKYLYIILQPQHCKYPFLQIPSKIIRILLKLKKVSLVPMATKLYAFQKDINYEMLKSMKELQYHVVLGIQKLNI